MVNYAQPLSISTDNDKLTKNDQTACELSLIHPINGAKVKPILYQDNYFILMDWEDYISPEGYPISYSLEIWNQVTPSDKMYYATQESYKYLIVDNLQIHDTYYWQVKAMDPFDQVCQSKTENFIKIDPGSGEGVASYIYVKEKNCQSTIHHANIQCLDCFKLKLTIQQHIKELFHIEGPFGYYKLNINASGYHSKIVNFVHKENDSRTILLSQQAHLKHIIMILKFLSGNFLSNNHFCEIDKFSDNKINISDVNFLMKELSNQ